MPNTETPISNRKLAYHGAIIAVAAVFAYSLAAMLYTTIRSSATIYTIMQGRERNPILWANAISVIYSIAVFSLVMSAPSAMAGTVVAVILKKLLLYFNPQFNSSKARLIGGVVALTFLVIAFVALRALLKEWMTFNNTETFLFWFLVPAAIFFTVCVTGGGKLNRILRQ
jgi:hypothetical protein